VKLSKTSLRKKVKIIPWFYGPGTEVTSRAIFLNKKGFFGELNL